MPEDTLEGQFAEHRELITSTHQSATEANYAMRMATAALRGHFCMVKGVKAAGDIDYGTLAELFATLELVTNVEDYNPH